MHLYAIRILVKDWDTACEFYGNIIGLPLEFQNADFGWAEFDVGGAKFGIERVDETSSPEDHALVGRFVGASLQVDDVKAIYQEWVAKGVEFTGPPEVQSWGGVLAHFKDPSGNIITLMSETS